MTHLRQQLARALSRAPTTAAMGWTVSAVEGLIAEDTSSQRQHASCRDPNGSGRYIHVKGPDLLSRSSGVVFPNLVGEYLPEASTPHLMWTEPFDFGGLSTFTAAGVDHPVHMLQAVPITDPEYALLRSDGFDTLEQALSAAEVRHYDLHRRSAV